MALCACVPSTQPEEPVKVVRRDENGISLRGLVDASRRTPPPVFDSVAGEHCARNGKTARFVSMSQRTTFAFDVIYECAPQG